MHKIDTTIIGHGLAGTALAWELLARGQRIAIIDPGLPGTCSQVAAGLVTPLTGAKASLTWRWGELWDTADRFYTGIERTTGARFWHVQPSVRLYQSAAQRAEFEHRFKAWPGIETHSHAIWPDADSPVSGIDAPHGAFSMSPSARLDTAAYLAASRDYFRRNALVFDAEFDWTDRAATQDGHIPLSRFGLETTHLVSCQGVGARASGPFKRLNLYPARGDILTIRSTHLKFDHVLHGETWLIPEGPSTCLVGATYDRRNFDCGDQMGARAELERRLASFMTADYTVIGQRAGIRPASYDKKPLIGRHPELANTWVLNGLGSKGASLAPWCAKRLAAAMCDGEPVDPALDWIRRLAPP